MTITIVMTGSVSERSASAGSSQSSRKAARRQRAEPSAKVTRARRPRSTAPRRPAARARERDAVPAVGLHGGGDADDQRGGGATMKAMSVSGSVTASRAAMSGPYRRELRNESPRSSGSVGRPTSRTAAGAADRSRPVRALRRSAQGSRSPRAGRWPGRPAQSQQHEDRDHRDDERHDEEREAAKQVGGHGFSGWKRGMPTRGIPLARQDLTMS